MTLPLPDRQAFDPENDTVPPALIDGVGEGEVLVLAADPPASSRSRAAAVALARAWSRRVPRLLLMDLELDRPGLHEVLGVDNGEGASDVFVFGSSIGHVARPVDGGTFYLSSAGTPTADPATVLDHPRWEGLVRGFREAEATLLVYVRSDLPGCRAMLGRADRIVLLGRGDEQQRDRLAGLEEAVIAVLDLDGAEAGAGPGHEPAPGAGDEEPFSGAGDGPPAEPDAPTGAAQEEVVDIAELAPDRPTEIAPERDAGPEGVEEPVPPEASPDRPVEQAVDIDSLAPDPTDEASGAAYTESPEVVDIAELAPDAVEEEAPRPGTVDEAAGLPPLSGTGGEGGEEVVDIESLAPDRGAPDEVDAFEWTDPGALEEDEEQEPGGLELAGSSGGPLEPGGREGALPDAPPPEDAAEEEVPDFGADLVTGPDFGGGAPGGEEPGSGASGAGTASPGTTDAGAPEEPGAADTGRGDADAEGAAVPGVEESAAAAEAAEKERRKREEEAERLRRLEEQLRAREAPRRRGRVVLLLALLLLVAGAAFAAHWYGYLRVPGVDDALSAVFGPARTGAAPTLVTEGNPPATPVLGHSLVVDEYRELGPAREVSTALSQRLPDHLFVIAPIERDSELGYRLVAGPARNAAEAGGLRVSLAGVLTRENPAGWEVRPTPAAFLLDEVESLEAARARVDALSGRDLPSYALRVDYPDRGERFRVYAGAYENEEDARAMQGLLAREGMDDAIFVERRGALPE